jgi:selenocysteine lyase/cysteine desulfurase
MRECFQNDERMTFEQFLMVMDGKATGAVRISLGVVSNFADVYRFMAFAETFLDRAAAPDTTLAQGH